MQSEFVPTLESLPKWIWAGITQSLVLLVALPSFSYAEHPVSVIEADIYVTKFKATMKLRCFAEDLELLQGVEALDDGFYDNDELFDATEDHADYLADKIELISETGERITGKVTEIDHFEIPEDGIRSGELMKYTIGIVIEYKYDNAPNFLTINQHVVAEGLLLPSELKILLKQEGSDDPFFKMMKPDQPETFRFDWNNPLPAADASDEERDSWFEQQREKTLGISSYSSVYSFIYITNYQVRHEVLIPLATLTTFFEIERADPGFLEIAEQDVVAEKIRALFSIGNPVVIDNVQVAPVFDRIDFYGLDLKDFAMQAERRRVSMVNGRVGIIMSYSTKGMPRDVKLTWDKFNDNLKTVDSIVFAFDDVDKTEFSMFLEDNTFEWNSKDRPAPLPISNVVAEEEMLAPPTTPLPIISTCFGVLALPLILISFFSRNSLPINLFATILVIGAISTFGIRHEISTPFSVREPIRDEVAKDVFEQLHRNLFRAFDYHNESDIYDALARSVDGELLRKLYLEINDTLRVAEQGGAVSKIDEVRILEGSLLPESPNDAAGFNYRSRWELLGTVEHWGHIHERNNTYDAIFRVELIDNDWKIREMQIEDFNHDVVKTRVRRL